MSLVQLAFMLLLHTVAGPLRSGPQPDDAILTPFRPLNLNGEYANEQHCLVCENGNNPVVMIFARDLSEPLLHLIRRLEALTEKHRREQLGAFVVFLKDGEEFRKQLEGVAAKQRLKNVILSIEDPAALEDYRIAADADVTVVLYTKAVVRVNHAWRRRAADLRSVDAVLADLPRILPPK